jgi:uncharacterized Ntn-hydrolase superfamily protein
MTWSIVAFDKESGAVAVAVTTRAFAVGSRCPFTRGGVGAVATQSISNWCPASSPLRRNGGVEERRISGSS